MAVTPGLSLSGDQLKCLFVRKLMKSLLLKCVSEMPMTWLTFVFVPLASGNIHLMTLQLMREHTQQITILPLHLQSVYSTLKVTRVDSGHPLTLPLT